jgi:zinc transport system substrate-binding protein
VEHDHSVKDPHIWLNPDFAREVIAARIASILSELDGKRSEYFARNSRLLREELGRLSERISQAVGRAERREFYVFHPAFGHFAEAYGLTQIAIEKHGKEPSAKQLAGLIEKAKKERVEAIFVQPQFARGSAEAVARAIGARIETLDPLAKDYMKNLEEMARRITSAVGGKWPPDSED